MSNSVELTKKRGAQVETKKKLQLVFRWALVSALAIAAFWVIWFLVAGSVPEATSLILTHGWNYTLPFGVSRWWDIITGALWSAVLVSIVTTEKDRNKLFGLDLLQSVCAYMIGGIVIGLLVGLIVVPNFYLHSSLPIKITGVCNFGSIGVMVVGLFGGLTVGLFGGPGGRLIGGLGGFPAFFLTGGLIGSLVSGLIGGPVDGLIGGLIGGLFGSLIGSLTYLLKLIVHLFQHSSQWLPGKRTSR